MLYASAAKHAKLRLAKAKMVSELTDLSKKQSGLKAFQFTKVVHQIFSFKEWFMDRKRLRTTGQAHCTLLMMTTESILSKGPVMSITLPLRLLFYLNNF